MPDQQPPPRTDKGLESPAPTRDTAEDTVANASKPVRDGPQEIADAAEQEAAIPADETDEG